MNMTNWAKEREIDIYHERANHEDNLNLNRALLFVRINAFFAVALGLVQGNFLRIIFAAMVSIVDIFWVLWAPRSQQFIRLLRDAGGDRPDEKLWRNSVGPGETEPRTKWYKSPLRIMCSYIPKVLMIGWLVILIYYILSFFVRVFGLVRLLLLWLLSQ